MAASFPKIWTTILYEDWFVKMPCIERGVLLQLYIIAKIQGDTGRISYRSVAHFATDLYIERRTLRKVLAKFTASGRIITTENTKGILSIFIPKYMEYQELSSGKHVHGDGKFTDINGKNTITKRTELKRSEMKRSDDDLNPSTNVDVGKEKKVWITSKRLPDQDPDDDNQY